MLKPFLNASISLENALASNGISWDMNRLCEIPPEELTVLATAISIELARDATADEILVMRNLLSQISQTLFTLSSQRIYCARSRERSDKEIAKAADPIGAVKTRKR